MLGEFAAVPSLTDKGGRGETRGWALWDHATSRVASATRTRASWSEIARPIEARYLAEPRLRRSPRRGDHAGGVANDKSPKAARPAQLRPRSGQAALGPCLGGQVSLLDSPPRRSQPLSSTGLEVRKREFPERGQQNWCLPHGTF